MVINPIVGVYIPIIRILSLKVGWVYPQKNATFDHGTDGGGFPGFTSLLVIYRKIVCFHPGSESLGKIHSKCSTSSSKKQIPDRFADTFLGKKKYPKNDW